MLTSAQSTNLLVQGKEGVVRRPYHEMKDTLDRLDKYCPPMLPLTVRAIHELTQEVCEFLRMNSVA